MVVVVYVVAALVANLHVVAIQGTVAVGDLHTNKLILSKVKT